MNTVNLKVNSKTILADIITPVSVYMKIRDYFPFSMLLESSDYHSNHNSNSVICMKPIANYIVKDNKITMDFNEQVTFTKSIEKREDPLSYLKEFAKSFTITNTEKPPIDGIFGYNSYDAIKYFEDIKLTKSPGDDEYIPDMRYSFYKYILFINHYRNELQLIEFVQDDEVSEIDQILNLLNNRNISMYDFTLRGEESSNMTDEQFKSIVSKGKEHCFRGDVFQIVLSRQFKQMFAGDDFNVYRALRSINPSPYLFYFDYGNYKLFGSSPETQIEVKEGRAYINPIAGTFRRTGNDEQDRILAEELSKDPKENAEHIMLVDLARNDLSRTTDDVTVEKYREIQFYSHVLHMVSKVSGKIKEKVNSLDIMAESFPAGTLSGAPKFKAMEIIDHLENKARGFYGGSIGFIRFNGDINQAIMIRSFLSKDNTLYYQAGAGVVSRSVEENELNEVNNKLAALKRAINLAAQM